MKNYLSKIDKISVIYSVVSGCRKLQYNYEKLLTSNFNSLYIMELDEVHLTKVIEYLLNPEQDHMQGNIFLKRFLKSIGYEYSSLGDFIFIEHEYDIGGNGRIDIFIQFENHCFIIENKLWGDDHKGQIDKYIKWLEKEYDKYTIIYLTMQGKSPKYMSSSNSEKDILLLSYRKNIYEWLSECIAYCRSPKVTYFLKEFREWIEFKINVEKEEENSMSISDIVTETLTEDRHRDEFEMLLYVNQFLNFDSYIKERCAELTRNRLLSALKEKFPSYSIEMDNPIFSKKQGWISLYKTTWVKDNGPVIFYAIETLSLEDRIGIGVSKGEEGASFINEKDILNTSTDIANKYNSKLMCGITEWWIGQFSPPLPDSWHNDGEYFIQLAWHLANKTARKKLINCIIQFTDELIKATEKEIDIAVQHLKD